MNAWFRFTEKLSFSHFFSILKLEISLVNDYHEHPLSYISLERPKNNHLKNYFPKGEKSPHRAKFLKNPNFTRNAVLMQNLDSGRKIRRI